MNNFSSFFFCDEIDQGKRPAFNDYTPIELKEMISKCWSQNPKDRPSFDHIFELLVNYLSQSNEMIDRSFGLHRFSFWT